MVFTKKHIYKLETYKITLDAEGDPTDIKLIETVFSNKTFEEIRLAIKRKYDVCKIGGVNDHIFWVDNGTLKIIIHEITEYYRG